MSALKSTLGHPLTDDEEALIRFTWSLFEAECERARNNITDPIEMLEIAAETIGRGHKIQNVIHDCWSDANHRAVPKRAPSNLESAKIEALLVDLHKLGYEADDILKAMQSAKEP